MNELQKRFPFIQSRFARIQEAMGGLHHHWLMMEDDREYVKTIRKGLTPPPPLSEEGEPEELLPAIRAFNAAPDSSERVKAMGMLESAYIAAKKLMRESEDPGCHMVVDPYSSAYGKVIEDEQKERHAEFCELSARYKLSNVSIAEILRYRPETVSRFLSGKSPIPEAALSTLRRVVSAIEAAK